MSDLTKVDHAKRRLSDRQNAVCRVATTRKELPLVILTATPKSHQPIKGFNGDVGVSL